MTAEPVGHLAVPSVDHNVHVDLPCLVGSLGAHAGHPGGVVPGDGWSPSGRPGLRPHNRLLRLSRLGATTHLLPSGPSCLTTGTGQDLLLSRTVIGWSVSGSRPLRQPYVDRFACDWHRLADGTCSSPRRNHGPGRTPCRDASRYHPKGPAVIRIDKTTGAASRPPSRCRAPVTPLASSARCASRAVAPVVSTSSQTTAKPARRAVGPAGATDPTGSASSRPGSPPGRRRPARPGPARARHAEQPRDPWRRTPGTRRVAACRHGQGVRRVVAAGAHRRGPRRHRHQDQRHRARRPARPARPPRRPAARRAGGADPSWACSLCPSSSARSRSAYSPAAQHPASPVGQGVGPHRTRDAAQRAGAGVRRAVGPGHRSRRRRSRSAGRRAGRAPGHPTAGAGRGATGGRAALWTGASADVGEGADADHRRRHVTLGRQLDHACRPRRPPSSSAPAAASWPAGRCPRGSARSARHRTGSRASRRRRTCAPPTARRSAR